MAEEQGNLAELQALIFIEYFSVEEESGDASALPEMLELTSVLQSI